MTGHCLWYLNRLGEAVEEAQRACDEAKKYGGLPVQVFAAMKQCIILLSKHLKELRI